MPKSVESIFKTAFKFELAAYVSLLISILFFIVYIVCFTKGTSTEASFNTSLIGLILPLVFLGFSLFHLSKIKKPKDENPNLDNDRKAKVLRKGANVELSVYSALWLILIIIVSIEIYYHSRDHEGFNITYGIIENEAIQSTEKKSKIEDAKSILDFLGNDSERLNSLYSEIIIMPISQKDGSVIRKETLNSIDTSLFKHRRCDIYMAPLFDSIEESIKNDSTINKKDRALFLSWILNTETKIEILKHRSEKQIATELYPILVKAQTYFILLFMSLLIFGIIYWHLVNKENILLFHLTNTEKEPEALKELEFSKLYITILIVLMVPIIKPLESKDIQFKSPFWTIGSGSFSKNSPSSDCVNCKDRPPAPEAQIIFEGNTTTYTDEDLLLKIEKIINNIHNSQVSQVDTIYIYPTGSGIPTDLTEVLERIEILSKRVDTLDSNFQNRLEEVKRQIESKIEEETERIFSN